MRRRNVVSKLASKYKGRTNYFIEFNYPLGGRDSHTRKIPSSQKQYERLSPGDPLTNFVHPSHPKRGVPYELCDYEIVT